MEAKVSSSIGQHGKSLGWLYMLRQLTEHCSCSWNCVYVLNMPLMGYRAHYSQIWHIEYFKLKEWENGRSRQITWLSCLKQAIKATCERSSPCTQRSILISKDKGTLRIRTNRPCCFLQFIISYSVTCHISPGLHSWNPA